MTIVFYKVGQFFTRNYTEACTISETQNTPKEKWYVEYPHLDDLESISKISIEEIKLKYEKGEAKRV